MSEKSDSIKHAVDIVSGAGRIGVELSRHATPLIDEQFMKIAGRVAASSPLFDVIDLSQLEQGNRPDAINHDLTLLGPNADNGDQIEQVLSYVDLLLGADTPELQKKFSEQLDEHEVLDRLAPKKDQSGQKLIVVSNHLELSDQGFTLGLFQKAAREQGMDRFENHAVAVIGRAIGYLELKFSGENVIDGILRRAGSVLKTFPSEGTESLPDEERKLALYRIRKNRDTKHKFGEMIHSHDGRVIFMAPSGEQDSLDADANTVTMRRFGRGTTEMILDASRAGAIVLPAFIDYGLNSTPSLVEFSEPRVVRKEADVHAIGEELASIGRKAREDAAILRPDVERFATSIVYGQK